MWRTSLQTGINQIRANGRMVWIYYLTSLVLAIPLMLPLWNSLRQFLGTSEMGALLAGRLDWDFVFEFLHAHPGLLSSLGWLIATVFVLHFFWSLFLSGGVFAVFAEGRGYSALTFWSGAAKYFGRFVRLAAWTVLPALAVLLVLFLPGLVVGVLFGRDPYEIISYWT
ncbi:MAG: hypothetical protein ONB49_21085, partial [candidate division KSB1 bacterium]|nr:hypothetical protein [candidate division KSB1 bacterium]